MKAMKFFTVIALAMMSVFTITSCDNDNDVYWYYPPYPNALVTVKPVSDNGFYLQLDDSTTLFPHKHEDFALRRQGGKGAGMLYRGEACQL